jgi:hypothetical protein
MFLEEWRDIKGYEGEYQISNIGRYRSLDRVIEYSNGNLVKYKGKILSPFTKKNGYLQATLNRKSENKKFYIHRLVAIAFIPNDDPINKRTINHIDENKQNNDVSNLEWATYSQNLRHNDLHLRKKLNTDFVEMGKKRKIPIIATNVETGETIYFKGAIDAEREMGFSHQHVSKVCKGKLKSHKGYIFRYANS